MLSKIIECLKQDIRKQISCKRPLNTKQMNRVKNKDSARIFFLRFCNKLALLSYIKQAQCN